ncbi:hypothetical protein TrVE_jg5033 [Triparma verrucosa]|uniref:Transcriptional coactivator p15 (PC4) C-terminal domain-containing protein n=1 Tax=Triparma verrucosa TaxID=1606542 RepID=A0A9W7BI18_9STRA|nr:hypothetical protein TrVE_jg5033 [Triparma verrucosa]
MSTVALNETEVQIKAVDENEETTASTNIVAQCSSSEGTDKKRKLETEGLTSTNAANFTKFDNAGSDEYRAKIGSSMRRVTVSSYRGKKMVAIREYYEKDGEEKPGKKGISLSFEQYEAVKAMIADGSVDWALEQLPEEKPKEKKAKKAKPAKKAAKEAAKEIDEDDEE